MKKTILLFIFIFLIIGPSFTQTILKKRIKSTSLTEPKVTVYGSLTYTQTLSNIQSTLSFQYKGRTLRNLKVKVNNVLFNHFVNLVYQINTKWKTRLKAGDRIVLSAESSHLQSPFRRKVIFATYRIKHQVKLIFPKHNQLIDLSENSPFVKIKWDFRNYSGRVGLLVRRIVANGPNVIVVDVNLDANEYNLNSSLLLPSEVYKVYIYSFNNPDSRLGYFKLSDHCSDDSSIQYCFRNVSKFKTE